MGELAKIDTLGAFNTAARPRDPSTIGYPPSLLIELALKTARPAELKAEYGYDDEEWLGLKENPVFVRELSAMIELMKKEGMSFKMKARLQSEELLKTGWRLIHAPNDEVSPAVKADLIKTTYRIAGYDTKEAAAGAAGGQFNIQINLGS